MSKLNAYKLHYKGNSIDEMSKEELKEAFIEACKTVISPGKHLSGFIVHTAPGIQKMREDAELKNTWKRPYCIIFGHEWKHWFGNEFTCHRCRKMRIRL